MVNPISIHLLRCPECDAELAGLNSDVVFFCRNCLCGYEAVDRFAVSDSEWPEQVEGASEIKGGSSRRSDFTKLQVVLQSAPPDASQNSLVWLPMWAFRYEARISAGKKEEEYAGRILESCPWVWVTAFRAWRPSYFGDPGLLYTSNSVVLEMKPAQPGAIPLGCAVREVEARGYLMPTLLAIVDRHVDVASIDIFPEIMESRLVAVPFVIEGNRIKDTQIEWEWPEIFIEDIVSLRGGK